jgi:hypothetical protein
MTASFKVLSDSLFTTIQLFVRIIESVVQTKKKELRQAIGSGKE